MIQNLSNFIEGGKANILFFLQNLPNFIEGGKDASRNAAAEFHSLIVTGKFIIIFFCLPVTGISQCLFLDPNHKSTKGRNSILVSIKIGSGKIGGVFRNQVVSWGKFGMFWWANFLPLPARITFCFPF